jgi:predicted KAP-like P-loop ATPase
MKWKEAQANLSQSRSLKSEQIAVRTIGKLLKIEGSNITARISQMNLEFERLRRIWPTILSHTDAEQYEFEKLKKEIHELSQDIVKLMTSQDDQIYDIVKGIEATPKVQVDRLLELTSQLHDICLRKLDLDFPRCEEIIASREQLIRTLKKMVEVTT